MFIRRFQGRMEEEEEGDVRGASQSISNSLRVKEQGEVTWDLELILAQKEKLERAVDLPLQDE